MVTEESATSDGLIRIHVLVKAIHGTNRLLEWVTCESKQ